MQVFEVKILKVQLVLFAEFGGKSDRQPVVADS